MSQTSFVSFCIEKYAEYKNTSGKEIYMLFKQTKLLDLLYSDYQDLHGMGFEYLNTFFDNYLGEK